MKKTNYAPSVPTANIAVNKSRIKLYENGVEFPTYYLQKGQEFQIELFNPTSYVVLAKITLNNNLISQGGLVINPGQRVFLDRYLDVAKKFLFDTYEVSNTEKVKKAIESNGDVKIEFYKEKSIQQNWLSGTSCITYYPNTLTIGNYNIGTDPRYLSGTRTSGSVINTNGVNSVNYCSNISNSGIGSVSSLSLNSLNASSSNYSTDFSDSFDFKRDVKKSQVRSRKTIETGRIESGSDSSQEFKYVNKSFDYLPFHTVEYKLLPISQKVNTLEDINVKVYCTNCGAKLGKTDRFCSSCGTKK